MKQTFMGCRGESELRQSKAEIDSEDGQGEARFSFSRVNARTKSKRIQTV
jgi:hypothetical protein